ncbi:MAG TPA: RNA 2'-phosphotransferase [Kofleriaceae bacterium]|jgi:putative RNA 2'-phosphotransferase|nr:RNA 2'-phosphotransferase [Kofleriaceae bacterium]
MSNPSKLISLILRHEPTKFGVELDRAGWTSVESLLAALATHGHAITRTELDQIVVTSDKQRFALSPDGARIRANQGHSIDVELELAPATPPAVLYHGTVDRFVASIRAHGLVKGERHHVHMSADVETATAVGGRRGKPVVLVVDAAKMLADGHAFFRSQNGVWLVDHVPAPYLAVHAESRGATKAASGRAKIAQETIAACGAGFYTNARGEHVELAAIAPAVAGTVIAEPGQLHGEAAKRATAISVTGESTNAALERLAGRGHVACLNFASAKNAGGGFLGGAQAQEEALARSSALYPCLLAAPSYYARNRANRSPVYLDIAIYSPLVPFFRDDAGSWLDAPVLASVITCPAPNAGALAKYGTHGPAELRAIFRVRGALVLDVARHFAVGTLVLGAWGAGVFKNDPALVAEVFDELLAGPYAGAFGEVVFAVMGEGTANHRAFAARFS